MVALRSSRCGGEVHLVVNVVAVVGLNSGRWVKRTASLVGVGVEVVGQGVAGASQDGVLEVRVKLGDSPSGGSSDGSSIAGDEERDNRVDTHVQVAEESGGVQVTSTELSDTGNDNVARVDLSVTIEESLNGTVGGGSTVPVLGPSLGNVLVLAAGGEVCTNDAGDRLVVGDTTSKVGTVGEEVGVEDECSEGDDHGEWEVVDVRVVGLGE